MEYVRRLIEPIKTYCAVFGGIEQISEIVVKFQALI
jgi:hypothetical protein